MDPKSTNEIASSGAIAVVLTTIGADADAAQLARTLVEEGLAACVNLLPPMLSIYRWNGSIEEDREQQLLMKTAPERLLALEARLRALHPYELPEFIVLAADASRAYGTWVAESTAPRDGSRR